MNYRSIENALEILGLGKNEIDIYLQLLADPKITIAKITKQLKLNRNSVYYSLNKLQKESLVELKKDYSRKIVINSPSNIKRLLQVKNYSLNKISQKFEADLPGILGKFDNASKDNFKVYSGKSQLMEMLISQYDKAKDEILFFGSSDDFTVLLDQNVVEFLISRRLEHKIKHKILAFANIRKIIALQSQPNSLREIRFLPDQYTDTNFYHIIDNALIIWNPSGKKAYFIEDKNIIRLYKLQFEILWNSCKKTS